MKWTLLAITSALAGILISGCVVSKKTTNINPAVTMPPAGTLKPRTGADSSIKPNPKPFTVFFDSSKVRVQKGMINVLWQNDKYYFEIPYALLGKDFLAVTRFVRMAAGASKYGGEQANSNVLRFEIGPENKVFLRAILNIVSSPDSTKPIYNAVKNSNVNPIAAAFDVKAFSKNNDGIIIDVTDFFKGDNQVVSLNPTGKRFFNLGAIALDRSYIESINTFLENTEVRTVKTYISIPTPPTPGPIPVPQGQTLPGAYATGVVTIEMNTSFIKLPDIPMKRRFYDPRVGYFADQVTEFLDTTQRAKREAFIVRWRLEPKPEDVEKYKRGEGCI